MQLMELITDTQQVANVTLWSCTSQHVLISSCISHILID